MGRQKTTRAYKRGLQNRAPYHGLLTIAIELGEAACIEVSGKVIAVHVVYNQFCCYSIVYSIQCISHHLMTI